MLAKTVRGAGSGWKPLMPYTPSVQLLNRWPLASVWPLYGPSTAYVAAAAGHHLPTMTLSHVIRTPQPLELPASMDLKLPAPELPTPQLQDAASIEPAFLTTYGALLELERCSAAAGVSDNLAVACA